MPASPPGPPTRPKPPSPRRPTALLLTMMLAVLTAVLLIVFVLRLARKPGAKVNLGDQVFPLGKAVLFAPKVTAHGPLIFAPLRGSITLYVQHLGTDPLHGWLAFNAHDPDPPMCLVKWRPATADFSDSCHSKVFPADGAGLEQYRTTVDRSGQVIIDLRQPTGTTPPPPDTTTSVAPATTTTSSVSTASTAVPSLLP